MEVKMYMFNKKEWPRNHISDSGGGIVLKKEVHGKAQVPADIGGEEEFPKLDTCIGHGECGGNCTGFKRVNR